ncbi:MAG: hypothetical protein ABIP61_00415 [Burkholderiaceae bacterium]
MIAFVRTAGIAPGKTGNVLTFAKEVAAHFQKQYDVTLEVLLPVGGNPARIAWSGRYKDLAAMEAVNTRMMADKAYQELVGKHVGDFVPGSLRDAIWKTV